MMTPRKERTRAYVRRAKVKRRRRDRARILGSFTRAIEHAAMRAPEVSADHVARRKWRNARKRARRLP